MSLAVPVTVIGGGPVGSLLSIFLARQGHEVEVHERRPDMRVESVAAGRSINLALSVRGLHALEQVGLGRRALEQAVPMRGRLVHGLKAQSVASELVFQPYGKDDSECIYSISRGGLNQLLMSQAEATGKVRMHFKSRLAAYDPAAGELELCDERTGGCRKVQAPVVFGADGSASVLRQRERLREFHEEYLDYGYKELTLPPGPGGAPQLARNALHIWPRGTFMLIALPNLDGSFTCTLFLPFEGAVSFASLGEDRSKVGELFRREFGDVAALFPGGEGSCESEFLSHPTGRMVTIRCAPWNAAGPGGSSLLIGDAAHAIVPFFGQGMNCGFEDCSLLDEELRAAPDDWAGAFQAFSARRKPDADAIAELAVENFTEMRDKVADPRFLLEKQVERILQREFPGEYVSRYSMVTFSRVPYHQARDLGRIQSGILDELCRGIREASEVDLGLARRLISERL